MKTFEGWQSYNGDTVDGYEKALNEEDYVRVFKDKEMTSKYFSGWYICPNSRKCDPKAYHPGPYNTPEEAIALAEIIKE